MDFEKIFDFAVANGASDIHIQALLPPMMRISGRMRSVDSASLSNEQTIDLIASMVTKVEREKLPRAIFEGLDFSHNIEGLGRFRCSAYCHLGNVGIVMRIIRENIPTLEELNLPSCIKGHRAGPKRSYTCNRDHWKRKKHDPRSNDRSYQQHICCQNHYY